MAHSHTVKHGCPPQVEISCKNAHYKFSFAVQTSTTWIITCQTKQQNEMKSTENVEKESYHKCHVSIWNICKRAINSVHISQSTIFQSRPMETQISFFTHLFWPRKQSRLFELSPNYFALLALSIQDQNSHMISHWSVSLVSWHLTHPYWIKKLH